MKRIYQFGIVAASTALGAALGRGLLLLAGPALLRHMPASPQPAKHDFGDMFAVLMNLGYNMGLIVGVVMTLAVLGGLAAGLALARRVGNPKGMLGLRAA